LYGAQMSVNSRIFLGEDAACTYPALLNCKRVVITGNCSYCYRQREDSMLKKSAPFKLEAPAIKLLYDNMIFSMSDQYPANRNLNQQIHDYILSIFLIRSGGLIQHNQGVTATFPFGTNIRGKRVAIFSAGTFGQQLRIRLVEAMHCEIVGWYDDDYWEYRRCCLNVDPVESIENTNFDCILIATVNTELALIIKTRIAGIGVPTEKIKAIDCSTEEREKALYAYLSYTK